MPATSNKNLEAAKALFDAIDTGKGWEGCSQYCAPTASFSAQAEPLAEIKTIQAYSEWMKNLLTVLTDGHYEMRSLASDPEHNNVCAYAVFIGTHLGDGGPVPPTRKTTRTDYVYVMKFEGDKISQMTKIWNAGYALKELGWA